MNYFRKIKTFRPFILTVAPFYLFMMNFLDKSLFKNIANKVATKISTKLKPNQSPSFEGELFLNNRSESSFQLFKIKRLCENRYAIKVIKQNALQQQIPI